MGAEKIIQLLEAWEEELVKQLLRGNPGLVSEVARLLVDRRWKGDYIVILYSICAFVLGYEQGRKSIIEVYVLDCFKKKTETDVQDFALKTEHNVEALIRAWIEGRELKAEDFDWTPLTAIK